MRINGLAIGFYGFRLFRNAYFHVAISITYFSSIGLTLADALTLESIYYVSKCLTEMPTGFLADRYGRKTCLVASSVTAAAGYAMMVLCPQFSWLIVAELLLGLSMSLASGADSALVYEALSEQSRLDEYRTVEGRGWSMRNLGYGAASAVGSLLAARYGLGLPFLVSSVFILGSLPFLALIGEPPLPSMSKKQAAAARTVFGSLIKDLRFIFVLLFFSLEFIYVRVGFWVFQPALRELQVPVSWFGPLFCATLAISLAAGMRMDLLRLSPGGTMLLLTLPILAFHGFLAWGVQISGSEGLLLALLGFSFHAVVQGIYDPIMREWINTFSSSEFRATTLSLASMLGNLGFAAVAPQFGGALERFGTTNVMLLTALLFAICLLVLIAWGLRIKAVPALQQLTQRI